MPESIPKLSASLLEIDKEQYNLTETEWETFNDLERRQTKFHKWLTARNLDSKETTAITCRTFDDSAKFWSDWGTGAQSNFHVQHGKGWRLWTKKYQNFSEGATLLMRDLKPVLDIVNSFGAPYSGLAIGTVTVLLMLASRKSEMEAQISAAIEGIKDRLPGLKLYQAIYTSRDGLEAGLRKKILFAYIAFIGLSMEIIKYYVQSGYRRWSIALFNSGKFKNMTDNVYTMLSSIRQRCEELLSLRINNLVHEMSELKALNQDLHAQIAELQRDKNTSHLLQVQELLNLSAWTHDEHHKSLSQYRDRLLHDFNEETIYQQMSTPRINSLRGEHFFVDWNKQSLSSLLILRGSNNENIRQGKYYNWVSLFALDVVYRLQRSGNIPIPPCATYVFDPRPSADPASRSVFTVILIILLQLMELRREELGNSNSGHHEALMAVIHKYREPASQADTSEEKKVEALETLAEQVVGLFAKERQPVYIVLDRVDQCDDPYGLMSILINRMMKKAPCVVKIILVADHDTQWPYLNFFRFDPPAPLQKEIVLRQHFLYEDQEY